MRVSTFVALLGVLYATAAGAAMPTELVSGARGLGLSADEIAGVESEPVAWIASELSGGPLIVVAGLVRISTPASALTKTFLDREAFLRSDAIKDAGLFSNPAVASDVASYRLPVSDLEALTDCDVADCKFKLGARGVEALEQVDWEAPDARNQADELMRRAMVEYVRRYREQGRKALLIAVDKEEPLSLAKGVEKLLTHRLESKTLIADLRHYLLKFPNAELEGAHDRIFWTVRDYGYRPVTSILHAVVQERPGRVPVTAVAVTSLYASHYFHGRVEYLGLFVDPTDPGVTYAAYVDQLLFDDEVGSLKRRMLEAGVRKDVQRRLEIIQKRHE
jgi:hypothetical protein